MKSYKPNIAHKVTTTYHRFQFGNHQIDHSVIRSKRIKTSEVIVDENNVVIRVPNNKLDSEIHNLLRRKGEWIIEKKRDYRTAKRQIKKSSFEIGSTLPYLGKNYQISLDSHNGNAQFGLQRGQFLVSGTNISEMYNKYQGDRIFKEIKLKAF